MINNIKELQKLIQLCRKTGVKTLKFQGVELELNETVSHSVQPAKRHHSFIPTEDFAPGGDIPDAKIITDELSEEQLLMWSAAPGGATGEPS